ncbi:MAG: cardiolipin synthase [Deltaproteobacteria bacterium]|nr:cardiolipin synthase [Deltaproteobacteria bacterium]
MWISILTISVTLWVAIVAVVIILQRRSAAATLAWLFVLVFLPIIGLVVYRLIGPQRLTRKKLKRSLHRRVIGDAVAALAALDESEEYLQLASVAMALGESSPLRADDVTVYLDGASTYEAILAAIAAAQHHVHLEYYIWAPDTIGTRLRDALVERAKAGIEVRMVVDGTGSSKLSNEFFKPLRAAGVLIAKFHPLRLLRIGLSRPDFRTHRKIVVCDGVVGFTGGMNITDSHSAAYGPDYWRDTHVRITGAAVWPLQRLFIEDWYFATDVLCAVDARTFPPPTGAGKHLVQVVGSGPDSDAFAIHKLLFTAINQSTRRLWLTTPYFVPDEALLTAIVTAGLRGVDVRLLVPKKGDSRIVDLAARSYFPELLAARVRVFEYESRFIHAKTLVCDDDVAIIGTANLDNRSFRLMFEVAAVVVGTPVNQTLADAFEVDLEGSRELAGNELEKQSFRLRLGQATARLFSPLL